VRPTRRVLALLGAAGLALALAACGVPVSGSPRALSKADVPPPVGNPSTTIAPADDVPLTIVLVSPTGAPLPRSRYVPQQQDRLSAALADLLGGPDPQEIALGISSAIPGPTTLQRVAPNPASGAVPPANPVVVNLSADFLDAVGINQVLAAEQVVLTVACYLGPPYATRVLFEVEGNPLSVPIGNGSTVVRPVTASDYVGQAPPPCTPAT